MSALLLAMKKKPGSVESPLREPELICPNCGQETTVTTPKEPVFSKVIFLKVGFLRVVGCQKCNKEFLIEDDMLKKVAQLWRSGKVAVLIWATNLDFVGFVDGAFC